MSGTHKSTIKLPRLRTKDELLKTSPELFNKLLLGEDVSSARSISPSQTTKSSRSSHSAVGQSALHRTGSRAGHLATYDTPRGFGTDDPLTVDQELAIELESVKRERQQLLESISQLKAEAGTAGGEAQQADIRQLLKELELKKAKLNELKGESRKAGFAIAKMRDDDTDAQRLTPDDCVQENAYIQELRDEMARVEEDLLEADAKNRLYYLLGERTRREHMAIDQKVRDKQESKRACLEDLANLTEHFNATRAAKEQAEKELAKVKQQVEEARSDWMRKIRERRAEVRELKKRQQKEREKEVKRREKQLEKEKADRAAQAKLKMEQEAFELQVAALAPKIEAMEASWNRLRAISGAETPNEVIEYWQSKAHVEDPGLKSKEQRMHDLVALAESREAACKAEITQLLANRSAMFESSKAAEAAAEAAAAAAAEAQAAAAAANGDEGEENLEAANARVEAAEKRMDAAQVDFSNLRSICVAAEQGMQSLLQRLSTALEEPGPTPAAAPAAPPSAASNPPTIPATNQPGFGTGFRLQSAGAMSSSGSHSGATGSGVDRRSGAGGSSITSRQGRSTRDEGPISMKSQRVSHSHTNPASSQAPASNLFLVPEGAAAPAATSPGHSRPVLPSRGKNTIEDTSSFFEGLPVLLGAVTEKLGELLTAGEGLNCNTIRRAAAANGIMTDSNSASTAASTVEPTLPVMGMTISQSAAAAVEAAMKAAAVDFGAADADEAAAGAAAEGSEIEPAQNDGGQSEANADEQATIEGHGTNANEEGGADAIATAAHYTQAPEGSREASAGQTAANESGETTAAATGDDKASASRQFEAAAAAAAPPVSPDATAAATLPGQGAVGDAAAEAAAGSKPGSAYAPGVPAAALAVGGNVSAVIPDSEKALMKGLYR
eukprot:GHRR01018151.1.p1 GENE.GHRR01018151.1~~GHRR01018151.1.p1  ORF type:complete len:898 (+),score=438.17 GHRR01018151.1:161-2854(+)